MDSSGTLTFTLQPDVSGTTTLTWTLSDNGGGANTSAPQTVVINVGAVNDPPAAINDAVTIDEDTVLTLQPLNCSPTTSIRTPGARGS